MNENGEILQTHPMLNIENNQPLINVLSADEFRRRVSVVFEQVANTLKKSYGPYGSSTIISQYPYSHVTKDGYTIAKYISFSKEYNVIDDSIKNLILAPCNRLNYAVGDGTTTAIVSVNAVYQQFLKDDLQISKLNIPPRDILKAYGRVCDQIIKRLDNEIVRVNDKPHDEMVDTLTKIAYISSNADEQITGIIHDLYDELDYPLIDIIKAPDGETKKTVTKGYHYNAILKDNLYVNNDNFTAEHKNVDVLLFDHKVTSNTFTKIIEPLNEICFGLKRHLIVIAPVYDDVAMLSMKRKLMAEYQRTKDVNLILMVGSMAAGVNRGLFEDLALLLNTTIINMGIEKDITDKIDAGVDIRTLLDINMRGIPQIFVEVLKDEKFGVTLDDGSGAVDAYKPFTLVEDAIRVGFAGDVVLGTKDGSTFDTLYYNEGLYEQTIKGIEHKLEESRKKSEAISAYNFEAHDLQTRLFKLKMKIGTIEVGGESTLSQELLSDAVDDTVKATASAYHNGIVKGSSTSTLRAIYATYGDINIENHLEFAILSYIERGFKSVFKTLLSSRYQNETFTINQNNDANYALEASRAVEHVVRALGINREDVEEYITKYLQYYKLGKKLPGSSPVETTAFDVIIESAVFNNKPFDVTTGTFSDDIVNSAKTDIEVIKASSDLISLLIVGNQFIVTDN